MRLELLRLKPLRLESLRLETLRFLATELTTAYRSSLSIPPPSMCSRSQQHFDCNFRLHVAVAQAKQHNHTLLQHVEFALGNMV